MPNINKSLKGNNYQYFIASRWRNKDTVLELTQKLRDKGKTVYCFIEGGGTENDILATKHQDTPEEYMQKFENLPDWQNNKDLKEIFAEDMNALKAADNVILLLPAGKSAHIEAGAAYGMKKHCIVIGEQKEAESLYLIFDEFYNSIDDFITSVK